MQTLSEIVVSNAIAATLLAAFAAGVARLCRKPPVVHALWLLVLLKLVTPPLVCVPLGHWLPETFNRSSSDFQSVGSSRSESFVTLSLDNLGALAQVELATEPDKVAAGTPHTDDSEAVSASLGSIVSAARPSNERLDS